MPPTTPVPTPLNTVISVTVPGNKQRALITFPTLAPLHEGNLGTIVGGAVGGALFLLLLLVLGGVYFQRRRRTFRGDYYTKQYLGPSDMQKAPPPPPPPPQELHIYTNEADRASPDTKLKSCHDVNGTILSDKDREEWGGFERERSPNGRSRALREANAKQNLQNHHNHNHQQSYQPNHHPTLQPNHQGFLNTSHKHRSSLQPESRRYPGPQVMANDSSFLPEDCYDSDYVSHTDGSMISRREWYV